LDQYESKAGGQKIAPQLFGRQYWLAAQNPACGFGDFFNDFGRYRFDIGIGQGFFARL
jgi:hypothetical protein